MIRVLSVYLGNTCRSPMAEFLLEHPAAEHGCEDEFVIASIATSAEEIGDLVHRGTVKKLAEHRISYTGKRVIQLTRRDYQSYDHLLGMEHSNLRSMARILGMDGPQKIRRLLDPSACPRDIADPWPTGNFGSTYDDILEGCNASLDDLEANGLIHPERKGK